MDQDLGSRPAAAAESQKMEKEFERVANKSFRKFDSMLKRDEQRVTDAESAAQALNSSSRERQLEALDRLRKLIRDDSSREIHRSIAARLNELLRSDDETIVVKSVQLLEPWGDEQSAQAVTSHLPHVESQRVRNTMLRALGELGGDEAARFLADRMGDRNDKFQAVSALKRLGAGAEDALLQAIEVKGLDESIVALQLLAEFGTRKSLPLLQNASKDANPAVQRSATQAIKRIESR